jgi:hypothetical protein
MGMKPLCSFSAVTDYCKFKKRKYKKLDVIYIFIQKYMTLLFLTLFSQYSVVTVFVLLRSHT